VAPGGTPAFELPLADLIFPLDIGIHRRVTDDPPVPLRDMPPWCLRLAVLAASGNPPASWATQPDGAGVGLGNAER